MAEHIVTVKNLSKTYPKKEGSRRVEVFRDVNLVVHRGEFVVLLGPSGCGKSTLLRILAGFDTATSGEVVYGKNFHIKNVSFVFQDFGVLPWLSVYENIELGLIGRGIPIHERRVRVTEMLEKLGLYAARDQKPRDLSGGMRQRVGIARAFVTQPDIIFLDEPFSELDFFTAQHLRQILLDLWHDTGTTVVMVSHYLDEAVTLADTIAVFSDRPGTIVAHVENDLPRPRNPRSPDFFARVDELLAHFGEK